MQRSLSDPDLSKTLNSNPFLPSPHSKNFSNKSFWSKKVGQIFDKKKTQLPKKYPSKLTDQERLEAHRRRNLEEEILATPRSPYYKAGVTDLSLVVHKPSSAGRGSQTTSSSVISFFSSKLKDFGACVSNNNSLKQPTKGYKMKPTAGRSGPVKRLSSGSWSGLSMESGMNKEEKPLRESKNVDAADKKQEAAKKILLESKEIDVDHGELMMISTGDDQKKFVWANKYQPKVLDDFICNRDKAIQLKDMVCQSREERCGHFIFEGPPGVGKKTMIRAMLREAFGDDKIQIREERKIFKLKSEMVGSVQVNVTESPRHVELNLSEMKGYEKQVISELILETHHDKSASPIRCTTENCRGIILCVADKLSTEALLYIKWFIEKYNGCNKIFFCCSDVSKLQPISPMCTVVRLLPPSKNEIVEVLEFIAKQEDAVLPRQLAEKIADSSRNNLRQAIRSLEATWQKSYPFKEDEEIMSGWEEDIASIAKKIVEEQSPKQLYVVRKMLKNLIEHNVSPQFIFKILVEELKKHVEKELQQRLHALYTEYCNKKIEESMSPVENEHDRIRDETGKKLNDTMMMTNLQLFLRIEEFIAKFMSCYKGETNKNNNT